VVAIALKTIGEATRFFLTRHWQQASIGPYVITTAETRPGRFETTVTWGEEGPRIQRFGSALSFDLEGALDSHEEMCERVEREAGIERRFPTPPQPPAA